MSSSVTVIGGINSGALTGLVGTPVNGVTGATLSGLQSALSAISNAVESGAVAFSNFDQATSQLDSTSGTSPTGGLFVVSDNYYGSAPAGAPGSGVYTVGSAYSNVIIQATGSETVTASNGLGQTFVLGATSNVDLFTGTGTGSVLAAGGNDTVNLQGSQAASVTDGQARIKSYQGNATVAATGSASVFASVVKGYAGTMSFVNDSSAAATVAGNSGTITVFGGTAGGVFTGGTAGNNVLEGGSGSVELVGGGNNDILAAGVTQGSLTTPSTKTTCSLALATKPCSPAPQPGPICFRLVLVQTLSRRLVQAISSSLVTRAARP